MKYADLPEDVKSELESTKMVIVRRSSLVDDASIDDVILLSKETTADLNQFEGYTPGTVQDWYEFVTRPYEGNDALCLRVAKEALAAV